jgi:hypothetical protein
VKPTAGNQRIWECKEILSYVIKERGYQKMAGKKYDKYIKEATYTNERIGTVVHINLDFPY